VATYTLTLSDVRDRLEHKLRTDQEPDEVDGWINDVVQAMTAEIFFDEMYKEGVSFTGDGSTQIFDCPEDWAAFSWMYSETSNEPLEEFSPRELVEDAPYVFDSNVQTPRAYAPLGRTGAAGVNTVPLAQVKFDSVIPSADTVSYAYYRLHDELVNDADYILLPQNLLKTIVDGVLMESDSWNDSDQFAIHRDRFIDTMNQLKRNQNRRPNKRRTMGRSSGGGRPGRPGLPSNYPNFWGQ